jgi:HSP20 family protein
MNLIRYSYPQYRVASPVLARSPWGGLESEIDRLLGWSHGEVGTADSPARLPVDIHEDKQAAYVRAELPGVSREHINLEILDGTLTITATRKVPAFAAAGANADAAEGKDAQAEDTFSFRRTVALSDEIDAEKVAATYENGLLTVTLPKREQPQPKKITVAVK